MTRTKAAIARLRAYKPPPFPLWDKLPLSRRAAVLILLYADRQGDLRVVLTMRAASLRSFSGPLLFSDPSPPSSPYQFPRATDGLTGSHYATQATQPSQEAKQIP